MLSRLVIAFLPRSKCLLISWLQSPSAVILEPKKIKSVSVSIVSLSIYHEVMGPDAMISVFWMLSFKPAFSLSSFTFIKRLFSFSSLLPPCSSLAHQTHFHLISAFDFPPAGMLSPQRHISYSFTSLEALLKCHLIREDFSNHPI